MEIPLKNRSNRDLYLGENGVPKTTTNMQNFKPKLKIVSIHPVLRYKRFLHHQLRKECLHVAHFSDKFDNSLFVFLTKIDDGLMRVGAKLSFSLNCNCIC